MFNVYDKDGMPSVSINQTPNLSVKYVDDPRDMYKCRFEFYLGDEMFAEITGATAGRMVCAFLDDAQEITRIALRKELNRMAEEKRR